MHNTIARVLFFLRVGRLRAAAGADVATPPAKIIADAETVQAV
jgi:hypothetical protein